MLQLSGKQASFWIDSTPESNFAPLQNDVQVDVAIAGGGIAGLTAAFLLKRAAVSAVCPHLGCVVNWNSAEKSWDCPCHGARYSYEGKVINGPAVQDLERLTETTP